MSSCDQRGTFNSGFWVPLFILPGLKIADTIFSTPLLCRQLKAWKLFYPWSSTTTLTISFVWPRLRNILAMAVCSALAISALCSSAFELARSSHAWALGSQFRNAYHIVTLTTFCGSGPIGQTGCLSAHCTLHKGTSPTFASLVSGWKFLGSASPSLLSLHLSFLLWHCYSFKNYQMSLGIQQAVSPWPCPCFFPFPGNWMLWFTRMASGAPSWILHPLIILLK